MDDQQQTSSTSCEKEIKLEIDDFNYNVANAEKSADADPGEEDFLRVVKVIKARKRTKDTSNDESSALGATVATVKQEPMIAEEQQPQMETQSGTLTVEAQSQPQSSINSNTISIPVTGEHQQSELVTLLESNQNRNQTTTSSSASFPSSSAFQQCQPLESQAIYVDVAFDTSDTKRLIKLGMESLIINLSNISLVHPRDEEFDCLGYNVYTIEICRNRVIKMRQKSNTGMTGTELSVTHSDVLLSLLADWKLASKLNRQVYVNHSKKIYEKMAFSFQGTVVYDINDKIARKNAASKAVLSFYCQGLGKPSTRQTTSTTIRPPTSSTSGEPAIPSQPPPIQMPIPAAPTTPTTFTSVCNQNQVPIPVQQRSHSRVFPNLQRIRPVTPDSQNFPQQAHYTCASANATSLPLSYVVAGSAPIAASNRPPRQIVVTNASGQRTTVCSPAKTASVPSYARYDARSSTSSATVLPFIPISSEHFPLTDPNAARQFTLIAPQDPNGPQQYALVTSLNYSTGAGGQTQTTPVFLLQPTPAQFFNPPVQPPQSALTVSSTAGVSTHPSLTTTTTSVNTRTRSNTESTERRGRATVFPFLQLTERCPQNNDEVIVIDDDDDISQQQQQAPIILRAPPPRFTVPAITNRTMTCARIRMYIRKKKGTTNSNASEAGLTDFLIGQSFQRNGPTMRRYDGTCARSRVYRRPAGKSKPIDNSNKIISTQQQQLIHRNSVDIPSKKTSNLSEVGAGSSHPVGGTQSTANCLNVGVVAEVGARSQRQTEQQNQQGQKQATTKQKPLWFLPKTNTGSRTDLESFQTPSTSSCTKTRRVTPPPHLLTSPSASQTQIDAVADDDDEIEFLEVDSSNEYEARNIPASSLTFDYNPSESVDSGKGVTFEEVAEAFSNRKSMERSADGASESSLSSTAALKDGQTERTRSLTPSNINVKKESCTEVENEPPQSIEQPESHLIENVVVNSRSQRTQSRDTSQTAEENCAPISNTIQFPVFSSDSEESDVEHYKSIFRSKSIESHVKAFLDHCSRKKTKKKKNSHQLFNKNVNGDEFNIHSFVDNLIALKTNKIRPENLRGMKRKRTVNIEKGMTNDNLAGANYKRRKEYDIGSDGKASTSSAELSHHSSPIAARSIDAFVANDVKKECREENEKDITVVDERTPPNNRFSIPQVQFSSQSSANDATQIEQSIADVIRNSTSTLSVEKDASGSSHMSVSQQQQHSAYVDDQAGIFNPKMWNQIGTISGVHSSQMLAVREIVQRRYGVRRSNKNADSYICKSSASTDCPFRMFILPADQQGDRKVFSRLQHKCNFEIRNDEDLQSTDKRKQPTKNINELALEFSDLPSMTCARIRPFVLSKQRCIALMQRIANNADPYSRSTVPDEQPPNRPAAIDPIKRHLDNLKDIHRRFAEKNACDSDNFPSKTHHVSKLKDAEIPEDVDTSDYVNALGNEWAFVCVIKNNEHLRAIKTEQQVKPSGMMWVGGEGQQYFYCTFGHEQPKPNDGRLPCPYVMLLRTTSLEGTDKGRSLRRLYHNGVEHVHQFENAVNVKGKCRPQHTMTSIEKILKEFEQGERPDGEDSDDETNVNNRDVKRPKHSTKKTISKKKDEKFRYSDAIYDFVGRTGKRWKFVCDVLSDEHMAELRAEHKVVTNYSKPSDGVYYFICQFGRSKNGGLLGTCPPCHFSMMTRIVEVENGERVRKLYQGCTGHNHVKDAEMSQSKPAEVQPESYSSASTKNHKKESTSTETVGAVPEQSEQRHQKGKGYDTILEYDFTHRTGGKKWKFIGKIHNEEKLEQLRREYGVRRSTSRNIKDEFALVHFCCPFGRDIKARYKCPFSMMLRTVRRKSGQIVRKLYRSLDGHSHERKGTEEYVCSTLIAAKLDDEPDTPTDEDEEMDDDNQLEIVQKQMEANRQKGRTKGKKGHQRREPKVKVPIKSGMQRAMEAAAQDTKRKLTYNKHLLMLRQRAVFERFGLSTRHPNSSYFCAKTNQNDKKRKELLYWLVNDNSFDENCVINNNESSREREYDPFLSTLLPRPVASDLFGGQSTSAADGTAQEGGDWMTGRASSSTTFHLLGIVNSALYSRGDIGIKDEPLDDIKPELLEPETQTLIVFSASEQQEEHSTSLIQMESVKAEVNGSEELPHDEGHHNILPQCTNGSTDNGNGGVEIGGTNDVVPIKEVVVVGCSSLSNTPNNKINCNLPSIKASNEHPNEVVEAISDLCDIVVCLDDVAAEVDAPGSSKVTEAIQSNHAFVTPTSSLPPGFEYINDEDFSIVESIPSESLEDLVEKLEQSIDCAQSAEVVHFILSELDSHIPEECRRSRVVRSTRRWLHKWHLNDIADRSGNDGRQQSLSICSVGGSSCAASASRAGVISERKTEGFGEERVSSEADKQPERTCSSSGDDDEDEYEEWYDDDSDGEERLETMEDMVNWARRKSERNLARSRRGKSHKKGQAKLRTDAEVVCELLTQRDRNDELKHQVAMMERELDQWRRIASFDCTPVD